MSAQVGKEVEASGRDWVKLCFLGYVCRRREQKGILWVRQGPEGPV